MGVVWKAADPILDRIVAIKTISATLGADDDLKKRFLREAQAAARINHPNIITVYDFGQTEKEIYLAMEFLEGKDLKELIKEGQLSLDQKLDLMEQIADGLGFAHGRDIVHRDLKPGNIHVSNSGQAKILDFGLARLGGSDLTRTGIVMGTPNYMSPEQVMGERVDARSDVFAAGAVFYELLTNQKPFDGDSVHAILYQVVHREPQPARQWNPDIPVELATIVESAMTKAIDGRYKDGAALRDAIRAYRYGEAAAPIETVIEDEPLVAVDPDATSVGGISQATLPQGMPAVQQTAAIRRPVTGYAGGNKRPSGRPGSTIPPNASRSGPVRGTTASAPVSQTSGPVVVQKTNPLLPILGLGAVLLLGVGGFFAFRSFRADQDSMRMMVVDTYVDAARDRLKDKNFQGAIEKADQALRMDAANAAATAVRAEAQKAIDDVGRYASAARTAFDRGDTAEASKAVEQLLQLDPKNAVIAELSGKLNANFEARAQAARRDAVAAQATAQQTEGAAADPAFGEGTRVLEQAENSLAAREFTASVQKFVQAKDAFERARRAIEAKAREAARTARTDGRTQVVLPTPAPVQTPTPMSVPTAIPVQTPNVLTPVPVATPTPSSVTTPPPTPGPIHETPAPVSTPVVAATPAPVFSTGRTSVTSLTPGGTKQPKGFDLGGGTVQDFVGAFEFEVQPTPPPAGGAFSVRIFLRNTGQRPAKLDNLTARPGGGTPAAIRLIENDVKAGQRVLVGEYKGTWPERGAWSLEVEALSAKGEKYRATYSAK